LELIKSEALFIIAGPTDRGTGLLTCKGRAITGLTIFFSSGIRRNSQFIITYQGIVCFPERECRLWQFLIFKKGRPPPASREPPKGGINCEGKKN
jgi:hypothetical protein